MQKDCYFCQEVDLNHCLTKSLYNKHNDAPDKRADIIDTLMDIPRTEQQQQERLNSKKELLRYKEILHMNDDQQNITEYLQDTDKDVKELLEYYKYRIYVPLFRKSACVNTIHCYYYEKLKLYYNDIKRNLNMTVVDSQLSSPMISNHPPTDGQQDEDFGHEEDFMKEFKRKRNGKIKNPILNKKQAQNKPKKNSKLLKGITIQEEQGIKAYQTESKALQNLVKLLKKSQKLKKVQTLKTQDCEAVNEFKDANQRIVFPLHDFSKKGMYDAASTAYIKYKLVAKSKTKPSTNVSNSNSKSYKKLKDNQPIDNIRKKSIDSIKVPHKQTSLRYLRSKENKLLLQKNNKNSFVKDQKQIHQSIDRFQGMKLTRYGSMPKVTMKFEGKPIRSSSTSKMEGTYQKNINYISNINGSNKMATLSPYKQSIIRNEKAAAMIQASQIRTTIKKVRVQSQRESNRKQTKELSPKDKLLVSRGHAKKIKANGFQIDSTDNIINIRKKKLQALKARSDRKKID